MDTSLEIRSITNEFIKKKNRTNKNQKGILPSADAAGKWEKGEAGTFIKPTHTKQVIIVQLIKLKLQQDLPEQTRHSELKYLLQKSSYFWKYFIFSFHDVYDNSN